LADALYGAQADHIHKIQTPVARKNFQSIPCIPWPAAGPPMQQQNFILGLLPNALCQTLNSPTAVLLNQFYAAIASLNSCVTIVK